MNQFNRSLITKHSNLDANDSLSSYKGYTSQQHHNAYEVFFNLLNIVKPKQILEIGTALGGFTSFLNEVMREIGDEYRIRSYDIYDKDWYEDIRNAGVDIRIENIFSSTISDDVIEFIQSGGVTLVLCDGGNKQNEFNVLSKYLKINDIIMTHDYAKNLEYFSSNINKKIWNWCEITYDDVKEAVVSNGLEVFMQTDAENVAWACFKKYK